MRDCQSLEFMPADWLCAPSGGGLVYQALFHHALLRGSIHRFLDPGFVRSHPEQRVAGYDFYGGHVSGPWYPRRWGHRPRSSAHLIPAFFALRTLSLKAFFCYKKAKPPLSQVVVLLTQ